MRSPILLPFAATLALGCAEATTPSPPHLGAATAAEHGEAEGCACGEGGMGGPMRRGQGMRGGGQGMGMHGGGVGMMGCEGMGPAGGAAAAPVGALTPDVSAALERALQDEYLAQQTYAKVLRKFPGAAPFRNIEHAEERHAWAIESLYAARGITPPRSRWSEADLPSFDTPRDACAAGVAREKANIAMYDELLAKDLPADVRRTFEHLRSASQHRHLPAFEACD